jgi:hypothetical protein
MRHSPNPCTRQSTASAPDLIQSGGGIIIFVVSEAHPIQHAREREINMLTAGKCGQLPAPIYQIVSIVYWSGSKRDVFYCRDARIISNTWRLVFLLRFDRSGKTNVPLWKIHFARLEFSNTRSDMPDADK